jgi:hypothetical protein
MISRKAPFRIAGTADFDQVFSEMSGIAEWCQQGTSIPVSDLSTHRGARNVLVDTATDPDYLVRVGDSLAVTDPQLGQGAFLGGVGNRRAGRGTGLEQPRRRCQKAIGSRWSAS